MYLVNLLIPKTVQIFLPNVGSTCILQHQLVNLHVPHIVHSSFMILTMYLLKHYLVNLLVSVLVQHAEGNLEACTVLFLQICTK